MSEHGGPIPPGIQYGHDQANGAARPLDHGRSLELTCPQLSLKVEKRPLHLHGDHPGGSIQHHVNRPPVRRHTHGDLQPNAPGLVCGGSDRLGHLQLSGVAQADAVGRIHAKDEIMAGGSCEPMNHVEARHRPTMLSLADQGLRDPGPLRQLRLRQTGHRASGNELAGNSRDYFVLTRAEPEARRGHSARMAGGANHAVTAPLRPVCYDASMSFTRRTKAIIAAVLSVGWLLYMIVGLQVINIIAPIRLGSGPEGAAAFVGLVAGVFVAGFVMWAASD